MNAQINKAVYHCARFFCAILIAMTVVACGGGGGGSGAVGIGNSGIAITNANTGQPIGQDAIIPALTEVSIAGIDPAGTRVAFTPLNPAQGGEQILEPDLSNPGEYWSPLVLERKSGVLSILLQNGTNISELVTMVPWRDDAAPGVVVQSFLQAALNTINGKINTLGSNPSATVLLQAFQATQSMIQQQLLWIEDAMRHGSTVIAQHNDGSSVALTTEDLRVLDQIVLYLGSVALVNHSPSQSQQLAALTPVQTVINWLVPTAFAQESLCTLGSSIDIGLVECEAMVQTNDPTEFAQLDLSTGQALDMIADTEMNLGSGFSGFSDEQAGELNTAGLYSAYYAIALTEVADLNQFNSAQLASTWMKAGINGVSTGIQNEEVFPDLADVASGTAINLVNQVVATKLAAEDIPDQLVHIAQASGGQVCPDGLAPNPYVDAAGWSFTCGN